MLDAPLDADRIEAFGDVARRAEHAHAVLPADLLLEHARRREDAVAVLAEDLGSALSSNSATIRGRTSQRWNHWSSECRSAVLGVGRSIGAPSSERGNRRPSDFASAGVAKSATEQAPSGWLYAFTETCDGSGASVMTRSKPCKASSATSRSVLPS